MDKDDIEEIGKEINDALEPEQLIEETDELRQQLDEERSILELAKIVQGLRASGKPSQKALFEVQLQICEKVRRFEETLPSPAPVVPRWQRNAPYTIWEESDDVLDKLGVVVGHDSVNYEEVSLRLIQEGIPENTLKAYRGDIRYIGAWLSLSGYDPRCPLEEEWVEKFIIDHIEGFSNPFSKQVEARLIDSGFKSKQGPHSFETIKRRLTSLSNYCNTKGWRNPVRTSRIKLLLRQVGKKYATSKQPKAITRSKLNHMIDQTGDNPIGIRDRAMIAFMFASGGRRRSEVEEALIEDLEDIGGEGFLFHLRRTKTNKTGKTEPKPVTGIAAKYLREWLLVLNETSGPLFRPIEKGGAIKNTPLKGAFINRIIKRLASKAGYPSDDFSAHSIRIGFVSQAAREGCSMPEVKALTGHKTDSMVSRYYQSGNVLRSRAGNLL